MTSKTISEIKPEVYTALESYLSARIICEMTERDVKESRQEVISSHNFYYDLDATGSKGERITEGRDDYMMSDTAFTDFSKLLYASLNKKGYFSPPKTATGVDEWNYSIDWPTRKARYAAEDRLINTTTYIHGMEAKMLTIVADKKKALDLIIGLVNSINPEFLLGLKAEADKKAAQA